MHSQFLLKCVCFISVMQCSLLGQANRSTKVVIMAQNPSMAPSADEAYVHEHCKVLPGLPVVLSMNHSTQKLASH